VKVHTSEKPATLVGLVADGKVVNREVVLPEARHRLAGLHRFGPTGDQYVVLTLGKTVFWSQSPKRGPDHRLTRTWASAPHDQDGVVFTVVPVDERPAPDDADGPAGTAEARGARLRRQLGGTTGWSVCA
jgi:hypothetical protein